jgi:hypothetical protein
VIVIVIPTVVVVVALVIKVKYRLPQTLKVVVVELPPTAVLH